MSGVKNSRLNWHALSTSGSLVPAEDEKDVMQIDRGDGSRKREKKKRLQSWLRTFVEFR